MDAFYRQPVEHNMHKPRFIYITGCDGTGKTTQARLIMERLRAEGVEPVHRWLRYPFLLSVPLLAYARWRGYSWYEKSGDVRHGYWDFRRSPLLQIFLPWTLLLDALLTALIKVYLPLALGRTIVCERFVLDMLVDMSVAFGDSELYRRLPGRLYPLLLPRRSAIAILDLDAETVRDRRKDLRIDWRLDTKLNTYRRLANTLQLPLLANSDSISCLFFQVCELTGIATRSDINYE